MEWWGGLTHTYIQKDYIQNIERTHLINQEQLVSACSFGIKPLRSFGWMNIIINIILHHRCCSVCVGYNCKLQCIWLLICVELATIQRWDFTCVHSFKICLTPNQWIAMRFFWDKCVDLRFEWEIPINSVEYDWWVNHLVIVNDFFFVCSHVLVWLCQYFLAHI